AWGVSAQGGGRGGRECPGRPLAGGERFQREYGLSDLDAATLTAEREHADFFEAAVRTGAPAKKVANWFMTEMLAQPDARVSPDALGELVKLVEEGTISGRIAKQGWEKMAASGESPRAIVEREGLLQMSDTAAIEAACRAVVEGNPKQVEQYRSGQTKVLGFFVGQVMKATGGKANPALVNEILRKLLG